MKKLDWLRHGKFAILSALVYFLLDFPIQATGFLNFGSHIGIKNFLPSTLGLQLGPAGIVGSCMGCIATALLSGSPLSEVLLECITILIMGFGMWIVWHLGSGTHRIHFKRLINYMKYLGLLVGLSAVSGCVGMLFVNDALVSTVVSYTMLGLVIGIPINIMTNGLFCFEPILPPPYKTQYAVSGVISSDSESLTLFNEALEDFAFEKKLNQRRVFEIESCLEELSIRILANISDTQIKVSINYDDTISARLFYRGQKYNPLRIGKDEDELDIMSLRLIKHRALRAAYQYRNKVNHIHVVI